MNTLHLKYAVEVERTGSISRAADNLFMGQPNLSKAIRELEENAGITIFKRTSRGVTPTPKGEEFLKRAHTILNQLQEIDELKTSGERQSPRFSLTVPDSNYIAEAVRSFIAQIKNGTDVTIKKAGAIEGITNVTDAVTSMSLIRFESVYDSYFSELAQSRAMKCEIIWSFDAVLLASHISELSHITPINRQTLNNYTEITYGDVFSPQIREDATQNTPKKNAIKLDDRAVSLSLLSQMRYAYMITAPVPQRVLDRYGLVERKCEFVKRYTDMIIYPEDYEFTQLDHRFMNELFAAKNDVAFKRNMS